MGKINLYTIVTNDEYELPVKCDLRVSEAAKFMKTTKNGIHKMVSKPPKKSKYKVIVTGNVKVDRALYLKQYSMTHDRSEYFRQRHLKNKNAKEVG